MKKQLHASWQMTRNMLFGCILGLVCLAGVARSQNISGRITAAENGEGLPGVSILVKGTNQGTTTDNEGKYTLKLPNNNNTTLVVSFIGYLRQEIAVGGRSTINLALEVDTKALEEVVVVGYTTQKKQDLTGSVAVVELNPVKNNSSGNVMQALQGRVPGMYIEKTGSPNGANSRILIRGANTLGNNDPLYVIDGIPTTRPEVFQNMNPATIESIQVLKDASAESIYGARASNGVVIVTTKNGGYTGDKVYFQFNSSVAAQSEKSQRFKMLSSADRGRALWQASVNDKQDPAGGYGDIYEFNWNKDFNNPVLNSVAVKPFVGGDPNTPVGATDWQDVMYKTGIVTQNDLTASFGSRKSSIEINLGQLKNTGMLRFTNYDRLSGSINAITRAFNDRAKFGVNLRIANSNETLQSTDIGGAPTPGLAVTLAPTIPVYQKDGVTYAGASGGGYSDRNNPLHMQDVAKWNNANRLSTFGNIFLVIWRIEKMPK